MLKKNKEEKVWGNLGYQFYVGGIVFGSLFTLGTFLYSPFMSGYDWMIVFVSNFTIYILPMIICIIYEMSNNPLESRFTFMNIEYELNYTNSEILGLESYVPYFLIGINCVCAYSWMKNSVPYSHAYNVIANDHNYYLNKSIEHYNKVESGK